MAMDFNLTPEQHRVKDTCRELAAEFAKRAPEHDRARSVPQENIDDLRDAGLFGIAIPRSLGGLGLGAVGWVAAAEELAQGDASTALGFNMHVVATGNVSERDVVPQDRKEQMAELVLGEGRLMSAPLSEPASSSLLPSTFIPAVTATRVDGGYRLRGRKMFASWWEPSDYAYLYAHPADEPDPRAAVGTLVPTRQDGIEVTDIWHTLGMRATRSNQVDLNDAFVPDDLVLYRTDDFLGSFLIQTCARAFGGYTACYMGLGLGMVRWAQEHLATRTAKGFDQVNGYHPSTSSAIGEAVVAIESARLVMYRSAWEHDANGPSMATFDWTMRAKLAVGQAVARLAERLTLASGLNGLFQRHQFERMLRDAATAPIMPPNSLAAAETVGLLSMGLDPSQAPTLRMAAPPPPAGDPDADGRPAGAGVAS